MKRTLAFVCVLLSFTTSTFAYTGVTIELECPLDDTEFESHSTMSMTVVGQHTDFMRYGAIGSYYDNLVHSCPSCKYSGYETDFEDSVSFSSEEKASLLALLVSYKEIELDPAGECEVAAKIYEHRKAKKSEIASFYLIGSYLLKADSSQAERRKRYQLTAASYFEQAYAVKGSDTEAYVVYRYLLAELHRRAGDFEKSIQFFATAATEATTFARQNPNASGFQELVLNQQALALKRDDSADDKDFGDEH